MLCARAEDRGSCRCSSTFALLPARLQPRADTARAKGPRFARDGGTAESLTAAARLRARARLQQTRGGCDVILEAVVVSAQCPGVGQVIQSGPRFRLETKQCKSPVARVRRK